MLVLGIESSCDETGCALLDGDAERGPLLLADCLHSQIEMHRAYGGVVPELASRDHIHRLILLIDRVFSESGRILSEIDAIAVTRGPGLAGALLVGSAVAHGLGYALQRPVIGVHHLEGHLLSPLLSRPAPRFPFVGLLVSGGHTQLLRADEIGCYVLLGDTLDDAAGEAFDKVGQLLGLDYPGGPAVSRIARDGAAGAYCFPRPMIAAPTLDFSFSGLKTAVMQAVRHSAELNQLDQQVRADIARAFVEAVVDVLAVKAADALDRTGLERLVVAGGVGANQQLRERLTKDIGRRGGELFFPPLALCTDNGAMIALAGWAALQRGAAAATSLDFSVRPRWPLIPTPRR